MSDIGEKRTSEIVTVQPSTFPVGTAHGTQLPQAAKASERSTTTKIISPANSTKPMISCSLIQPNSHSNPKLTPPIAGFSMSKDSMRGLAVTASRRHDVTASSTVTQTNSKEKTLKTTLSGKPSLNSCKSNVVAFDSASETPAAKQSVAASKKNDDFGSMLEDQRTQPSETVYAAVSTAPLHKVTLEESAVTSREHQLQSKWSKREDLAMSEIALAKKKPTAASNDDSNQIASQISDEKDASSAWQDELLGAPVFSVSTSQIEQKQSMSESMQPKASRQSKETDGTKIDANIRSRPRLGDSEAVEVVQNEREISSGLQPAARPQAKDQIIGQPQGETLNVRTTSTPISPGNNPADVQYGNTAEAGLTEALSRCGKKPQKGNESKSGATKTQVTENERTASTDCQTPAESSLMTEVEQPIEQSQGINQSVRAPSTVALCGEKSADGHSTNVTELGFSKFSPKCGKEQQVGTQTKSVAARKQGAENDRKVLDGQSAPTEQEDPFTDIIPPQVPAVKCQQSLLNTEVEKSEDTKRKSAERDDDEHTGKLTTRAKRKQLDSDLGVVAIEVMSEKKTSNKSLRTAVTSVPRELQRLNKNDVSMSNSYDISCTSSTETEISTTLSGIRSELAKKSGKSALSASTDKEISIETSPWGESKSTRQTTYNGSQKNPRFQRQLHSVGDAREEHSQTADEKSANASNHCDMDREKTIVKCEAEKEKEATCRPQSASKEANSTETGGSTRSDSSKANRNTDESISQHFLSWFGRLQGEGRQSNKNVIISIEDHEDRVGNDSGGNVDHRLRLHEANNKDNSSQQAKRKRRRQSAGSALVKRSSDMNEGRNDSTGIKQGTHSIQGLADVPPISAEVIAQNMALCAGTCGECIGCRIIEKCGHCDYCLERSKPGIKASGGNCIFRPCDLYSDELKARFKSLRKQFFKDGDKVFMGSYVYALWPADGVSQIGVSHR